MVLCTFKSNQRSFLETVVRSVAAGLEKQMSIQMSLHSLSYTVSVTTLAPLKMSNHLDTWHPCRGIKFLTPLKV